MSQDFHLSFLSPARGEDLDELERVEKKGGNTE